MSAKFPRERRLLSRAEFSHVLSRAHSSSGRIFRSHGTVVYVVLPENVQKSSRIGFSISKKAVRKAHDRQRMKRCLREFFRAHQSKLQGDILVRAISRPEAFDFDCLVRPLKNLLEHQQKQSSS